MFETIVQRYLPDIEKTMRQIVAQHLQDEPDFGLMMRYALGWVDEQDNPIDHPGGKRLRPTLLLLCAEAAGGDWQAALPAAAAVELLHNFSLIHDDIQDNSALRHNRPTVWKVWGAPNAINAGDALFTMAYVALADVTANVSAETAVNLWQRFNRTNLELTRGQHLDMRFERQSIVSTDDYISMITGKSAALLAASAAFGALIARSDPDLADLYAEFGINIGIAFQVRDDILGIWGDPSVTGKSAATDIISQKKSLPVLYGLERSEELRSLYAQQQLSTQDVAQVIRLLDASQAQTYTRDLETMYYNNAMAALEKAQPLTEPGGMLREFVTALFQRNY